MDGSNHCIRPVMFSPSVSFFSCSFSFRLRFRFFVYNFSSSSTVSLHIFDSTSLRSYKILLHFPPSFSRASSSQLSRSSRLHSPFLSLLKVSIELQISKRPFARKIGIWVPKPPMIHAQKAPESTPKKEKLSPTRDPSSESYSPRFMH